MRAEEVAELFAEKQKLAALKQYKAIAIAIQCVDADYSAVYLYEETAFGNHGVIRLKGDLTEVRRLIEYWNPVPVYRYKNSISTECAFKGISTKEGAVEIAPFLLLSYVDQLVFRFWVKIDMPKALDGMDIPKEVTPFVTPFTIAVEVGFDLNEPLPIKIEYQQVWASSSHIMTSFWSKQTKFGDILNN